MCKILRYFVKNITFQVKAISYVRFFIFCAIPWTTLKAFVPPWKLSTGLLIGGGFIDGSGCKNAKLVAGSHSAKRQGEVRVCL